VTGRLLTAREVADRLGFTVETVLRWTRDGRLRAVRLGRALRYRDEDVDAFLEQHETGAAPREGASQPGGRAQVEGYAALPSLVRANPPRERGNNRGGP
jgi:excisionase family DNA binding protein